MIQSKGNDKLTSNLPVFNSNSARIAEASPIPTRLNPACRAAIPLIQLRHHDVENLMVERGMRKFKPIEQAQRFLNAYAAVFS